jgi:hypothetical protein
MKKPRETSPNSLENLTPEGRSLSIREDTQSSLQILGCSNVSEPSEKSGREQSALADLEALEDQLDLEDAVQAEADPENQGKTIPWEQLNPSTDPLSEERIYRGEQNLKLILKVLNVTAQIC